MSVYRVIGLCIAGSLLLLYGLAHAGVGDKPLPIFYVTDIEGDGAKWESFVRNSGAFESDWNGVDAPKLKSDVRFVFGGDAIDKDKNSQKILNHLVGLKEQNPDRVTLIIGNRDLNKMRLLQLEEVFEKEPVQATQKLQDYLKRINAPGAFEFRRTELGGAEISDEAVTKSMIADVQSGGVLRKYYEQGDLAKVIDNTLFVHGSVNERALGIRKNGKFDLQKKIATLDFWKKKQLSSWAASGGKNGMSLFGYQSSDNGVVYSRFSGFMPNKEVRSQLMKNGIHRVVVGHTPSGSSPTVAREFSALDQLGFEVINADNSAMKENQAMIVRLTGNETHMSGLLPDGNKIAVDLLLDREDKILGRVTDEGFVANGRLDDGRFVFYKSGNSENGFTPTTHYVEESKLPFKAPVINRVITDEELDAIMAVTDGKLRVERLKAISGDVLTPAQIKKMTEHAGSLSDSFEIGQYIRIAGESKSNAWTLVLNKWLTDWSTGSEPWMTALSASAKTAKTKIRNTLFKRCVLNVVQKAIE